MAAVLLLGVHTVMAQDSGYSVTQLNDHIYELSHEYSGYTTKVIVSAGDDGILLVDTGDKDHAEALKSLLEERWHGNPKVIILSHEHIEHIGGNEVFGTDPVVIGHSSLRSVLKSRYFLFEEYTDATLPEITFDDSISLFFNGEEIKLISAAGGHSGSDIIVWFTGSNIACVGALCNWPHYPSIDNTTGDVRKYPEAVKRVIDLLPENTMIVPGHGKDCSMAEFRQFYDMLVRTGEIVRDGLAQGKNMETLQKDSVLKDFKSYEGSYTSADAWIEYLVKGIQDTNPETRKSIFEDMYYTMKDKGLEAAVARYRYLMQHQAGEYDLDDKSPAIIGYLYFNQGRYPETIGFMHLSLEEYPDGPYAGLSYKLLAQSYEETNDIDNALINYKKLMELDPADTTTAAKVRELENR